MLNVIHYSLLKIPEREFRDFFLFLMLCVSHEYVNFGGYSRILFHFFLVNPKITTYFVSLMHDSFVHRQINVNSFMMDTQDTNVPFEETKNAEEGILEESQAPEISPAESAIEAEVSVENNDAEEGNEQHQASEITSSQDITEEPIEEPEGIGELEEPDFEKTSPPEGAELEEPEDSEIQDVVEEFEATEISTPTDVLRIVDAPVVAFDLQKTDETETLEGTEVIEEEDTEDAPDIYETLEEVNALEDLKEIELIEEILDLEGFSEAETEDFSSTAEEAPEESLIEKETESLLDVALLTKQTKPEIIERLKLIVAEPDQFSRNEADVLKQTFHKIGRLEKELKKKEFLEGGGDEADFVMPEDALEAELKTLLSAYRDKRATMALEEERQKEKNLVLKQHLIERLKVLTESQDDFNRRYNEFRDIQRKWKEIKLIPQEHAKELWRNYQLYNERFYDLVKINNQFREYDFKKNLELKTTLCETVERLASERDVISAFHQLQKLHQQWREIGPVSKEFRESTWERFKTGSVVINKKHQSHFEAIKAGEEKNLADKVAICKKIEAINYESLKTIRDWEKKTKEITSLRAKWRKIGYATKKHNVKVFERFRVACEVYFRKKSVFYQSIKSEMDQNLELKKVLIEKAEALKESNDWKETSKKFVELQNEWKKIGQVTRKQSDAVWKQFIAACDYFFEKKNKEMSSQKNEEIGNLTAKKELIEKINSIHKNLSDDEAIAVLRGYITEWNTIGFVPFKEKDKLHKSFREAVDKQFDRLKVNERDRRIQQYRSNLTELAGSGKNKLFSEREKLMRVYERMKSDLQTYENNIGFFNISTKGGDGLMKEMDRKIEHLKEEMEIIVRKIEAIDENLD